MAEAKNSKITVTIPADLKRQIDEVKQLNPHFNLSDVVRIGIKPFLNDVAEFREWQRMKREQQIQESAT